MRIRRGQGLKGVGWGLENALMRVEGVGELEGLLPWSRSRFLELLLCHNNNKKKKTTKERFECERTSEKRERQKGEKSPGI